MGWGKIAQKYGFKLGETGRPERAGEPGKGAHEDRGDRGNRGNHGEHGRGRNK
jgi:hypothetical protein